MTCRACGSMLLPVHIASDVLSLMCPPTAACPDETCDRYRVVIFIGEILTRTPEQEKTHQVAVSFLEKIMPRAKQ